MQSAWPKVAPTKEARGAALGKRGCGSCWETVGLPRPSQGIWVGGQTQRGGGGIHASFKLSSMGRGGRGRLAPVTPASPVCLSVAAVGTSAPSCLADGAALSSSGEKSPTLGICLKKEQPRGHLSPFPVPSKQRPSKLDQQEKGSPAAGAAAPPCNSGKWWMALKVTALIQQDLARLGASDEPLSGQASGFFSHIVTQSPDGLTVAHSLQEVLERLSQFPRLVRKQRRHKI